MLYYETFISLLFEKGISFWKKRGGRLIRKSYFKESYFRLCTTNIRQKNPLFDEKMLMQVLKYNVHSFRSLCIQKENLL